MIRRLCLLTKSYKNGGYCVVGIDLKTKEIIRLVNNEAPNENHITKEQMQLSNGRELNCFDLIEVDLMDKEPIGCQTENCIISPFDNFKYIKKLTPEILINYLAFDIDSNFIFNKNAYLEQKEIDNVDKSFFIYFVKNFTVTDNVRFIVEDGFTYEKHSMKCSFEYNGYKYKDISITDPIFRNEQSVDVLVEDAIIFASLPCIPYKNDLYYKFVAKVVPITNDLLIRKIHNILDRINNLKYIKPTNSENIKLSTYDVLDSLQKSIDPFTGEMITGMSIESKKVINNILLKHNQNKSKKTNDDIVFKNNKIKLRKITNFIYEEEKIDRIKLTGSISLSSLARKIVEVYENEYKISYKVLSTMLYLEGILIKNPDKDSSPALISTDEAKEHGINTTKYKDNDLHLQTRYNKEGQKFVLDLLKKYFLY